MRQIFKLNLFSIILLTSQVIATTFYGTVRDERSHLALYQAKVKIIVSDWDVVDSTYTNIGGRWMFSYTSVAPVTPVLPQGIALGNNYPNPFNPSTIIPFRTNQSGMVTFTVHDIRGRSIARETFYTNAGEYEIHWASAGAAGLYLYTLEQAGYRETRKMIQLDGGRGSVGGVQQVRQINGYLPQENLSKPAETEATIIAERLGYLPDTITVVIEENADYPSYLQSVHDWATLIDLHNDVLEVLSSDTAYHLADRHTNHHTDIPRMQDGGVNMQWFSVWISPSTYPDNPYQIALNFIDIFDAEVSANPATLGMATTPQEALALNAAGKIAGIYGVEGGHTIENSLDNLYQLYDLGMRYLTITWNNSTDWAVSAQDDRSETVGLSEFGRQVIRTLDSLGIIIDISHTGIQTINDILEETTNPIIATHSGVRALRDHYRNLTDNQIIDIANSGGVIGIVFYDYFLDYPGEWVSVSTVIDHIDYIVNLVGVDYVAIGSDYDGIGQNDAPSGLEDTSKYPNLTMGLINRGYSNEDIRKILGGNFMRVFEQVCGDQPVQ
ncbi:MAG: membrane dipeptidase [Lentisphaeria bacterium]|nr:membrane dipeptidase [Candidatus Neomarinimicrobiota bacterium]MCF7841672.1 membrane dipeptidase [Lentisphaeria bacterium]